MVFECVSFVNDFNKIILCNFFMFKVLVVGNVVKCYVISYFVFDIVLNNCSFSIVNIVWICEYVVVRNNYFFGRRNDSICFWYCIVIWLNILVCNVDVFIDKVLCWVVDICVVWIVCVIIFCVDILC